MLAELLVRAAAEHPERACLEEWDPGSGRTTRTLSFRDVSRMAEAARAELATRGVQEGGRMAILTLATVEEHIFSIAVMAAGAAVVPLIWRLPVSTLVATLSNARCDHLLASVEFESQARVLLADCPSLRDVRPMWIDGPRDAPGFVSCEPPEGLDGSLLRSIASIQPTDFCMIMFTSGSTGVPKAVPLTHGGMCWLFETKLRAERYPEDRSTHGGTMCFLPHFHVMGFCMNWLFNLSAGVRAFALSHQALYSRLAVTPELLLAAVSYCRPSVLTSVPIIVDAIADMAEMDPSSVHCLRQLDYILCGGARLNERKVRLLAGNGIFVRPNMGATELGGVLLLGVPGDATLRMRPMPGVSYRLEPLSNGPDFSSTSANERIGVLVYERARSVTPGYMVAGEVVSEELAEHWCYNSHDVVREVGPPEPQLCVDRYADERDTHDRTRWLLHEFREDDLLVHSTGEKTNPNPVEEQLRKQLGGVCARLCVVGTGLVRPILVAELTETARASRDATSLRLRASIAEVNTMLPSSSQLLAKQILVVDPNHHASLPVSAKGNVLRSAVSKTLAHELELVSRLLPGELPPLWQCQACTVGWLSDMHDSGFISAVNDGQGDGEADSLATINRIGTVRGGETLLSALESCRSHVNLFCCALIITQHARQIFLLTRTVKSNKDIQGLIVLKEIDHLIAVPAMTILLGMRVRSNPHSRFSRRAFAIICFVLAGLSGFPEAFANMLAVGGIDRITVPSGKALASAARFHTPLWFSAAWLFWEAAQAAFSACGLECCLGAAALLAHFAHGALEGAIPLVLSRPINYAKMPPLASDGWVGYFLGPIFRLICMGVYGSEERGVVLTGQWMGRAFNLWWLYSSVPAYLPRDFPLVLPLESRFRSPVGARAFWICVLMLVIGAFSFPSSRHAMLVASHRSTMAYSCQVTFSGSGYCKDRDPQPSSIIAAFAFDVLGCGLTLGAAFGLCALMPRSQTPFALAGTMSIFIYLFHEYVLAFVDIPVLYIMLRFVTLSYASMAVWLLPTVMLFLSLGIAFMMGTCAHALVLAVMPGLRMISCKVALRCESATDLIFGSATARQRAAFGSRALRAGAYVAVISSVVLMTVHALKVNPSVLPTAIRPTNKLPTNTNQHHSAQTESIEQLQLFQHAPLLCRLSTYDIPSFSFCQSGMFSSPSRLFVGGGQHILLLKWCCPSQCHTCNRTMNRAASASHPTGICNKKHSGQCCAFQTVSEHLKNVADKDAHPDFLGMDLRALVSRVCHDEHQSSCIIPLSKSPRNWNCSRSAGHHGYQALIYNQAVNHQSAYPKAAYHAALFNKTTIKKTGVGVP